MTDDEEYEIMPIHEVNELKKQIDNLKKGKQGNEFIPSIKNLSKNIEQLLSLFKEATEEIKEEEDDIKHVKDRLSRIEKDVKSLLEQNENIAEAIIAIHDMMLKKQKEDNSFQEPKNWKQENPFEENLNPMPQPYPQSQQMPGDNLMQDINDDNDENIQPMNIPPPPPVNENKKGFFWKK